MNIVSVNVSLPREVLFNGQIVTTGIFKEPVRARINLHKLNLDGDKQADLTVHGGIDKAVYSYPAEHYDFWREVLPNTRMSWGMFGENLTTEGLMEDAVNIGDKFKTRTATNKKTYLQTTLRDQQGNEIIARYFDPPRKDTFVLQEGKVGAGDAIKLIARNTNNITVKDIVSLYTRDNKSIEMMQRAAKIKDLPAGWRIHFRDQLKEYLK